MRLIPIALALTAIVLAGPPLAGSTPPGRAGLIAFVAHTYSAEVGNGIAVVRSDGRGLRRLTRDRRDRSPAWSPDGRRLAFERAGRIYVVQSDGSGLHRVTSRPVDARQPAWSPDGRLIAFTREAQAVLLVVRPDGSGQRVLYRGGYDDTVDRPAWSPDGRRIAFGLREQGSGSIAVIGRSGGAVRYVTDGRVESQGGDPGESPDDHGPDWSPDGTRILFTRVVWLCPQCDQEEVFSVRPDGSDVRWVTAATAYAASAPGWSPAGTRFVAQADGISTFTTTGTRLRIVNRLGTEPAWQPLTR